MKEERGNSSGTQRWVITHKNCVDGCACKSLLRGWFKQQEREQETIAIETRWFDLAHEEFDQPEHALRQAWAQSSSQEHQGVTEVWIADCAVPMEWIGQWCTKAVKVYWFDHHISEYPEALQWVKDNKVPYAEIQGKALRVNQPGLTIVLDTQRCGAWWVWEALNGSKSQKPQALHWIDDQDRFAGLYYQESKAFYAGLRKAMHVSNVKDITQPQWEQLWESQTRAQEVASIGHQELEPLRRELDWLESQAQQRTMWGHRVWSIELSSQKLQQWGLTRGSSEYRSELGAILSAKTNSFAVLYEQTSAGWSVSLKAQKTVDCDAVAKYFGGGGHAQACGFRLEPQNIETWLKAQAVRPSVQQKLVFKEAIQNAGDNR